MNRCLFLAKSQDCEPNFSVYHKDGWYTTFSFDICMRDYRSVARTRSLDNWQLATGQTKDCRFDRIGRPVEKPACESHKNSQNTMICSYASMESTHYRNPQGLTKAVSCSLFPATCLVWMLTQFAKGLDLVALGHNWCFQRTLAWMMDCVLSRPL